MDATWIPDLGCVCGTLRRTARALTQMYEREFRPLGLRGTQFTILQVLARAGEVSQGQLGTMLAMDSTSLTRTLAIMIREGWVVERRGTDRRERWLRLAGEGEKLLERAMPVWEKLQERVREQLGAAEREKLMEIANRLTQLAKEEGEE